MSKKRDSEDIDFPYTCPQCQQMIRSVIELEQMNTCPFCSWNIEFTPKKLEYAPLIYRSLRKYEKYWPLFIIGLFAYIFVIFPFFYHVLNLITPNLAGMTNVIVFFGISFLILGIIRLKKR